jgi:hypothetical protein
VPQNDLVTQSLEGEIKRRFWITLARSRWAINLLRTSQSGTESSASNQDRSEKSPKRSIFER